MKISRLELTNFRTFSHLVLEDVPDIVVLVSPNGVGKTTILEAIAGAHDLVQPYHADRYAFTAQLPDGSNTTNIWPAQLPKPLKIGADKAELALEVKPSAEETAALLAHGIDEPTGQLSITIEHGRHITSMHTNKAIEMLFRYHPLREGFGLVDYIPAVRPHGPTALGDIGQMLSDNQTKNTFAVFGGNVQSKFHTVKSYIMACQVSDDTRRRETGQDVDSLETFREVFNYFFDPKQFLGVTYDLGGQPTVDIKTPFGKHDIDDLSDGEKEIARLMAHLHRFRDLENIVLWDTPESQLNAALESRLHDALVRIAPNNQFLIATHSLEFINSVPLDNLFTIRWGEKGACIERTRGSERKAKVSIYQELGAQVGLQLVSSVVVFVEGKETHSDKRILDRLIAPLLPNVNFIAGKDSETVFQVGSRVNRLFEEATKNGDFLSIIDRDYMNNQEYAEIEKKYAGRVFVWKVHEIENLFLDPEIVFETLRLHDQLKRFSTPHEVKQALVDMAKNLREWIAADWLAWQFDRKRGRPGRWISRDSPETSLKEYIGRIHQAADEIPTETTYKTAYTEKLAEVDSVINKGRALELLPGKQILQKFLDTHTSISTDDYRATTVSIVQDKKIKIAEIERLKNVLKQRISQAS
jgi:predicted ATPase